MKNYKILITSTLGRSGNLVSLNEASPQTGERLKKGIIAEHKTVTETETKTPKKSKAK